MTFWTSTGRPVRVPRDAALPVVLLPARRNTRHGRTGTQLDAGPSQVCISPSEPSRTDTVQGQGGRGADPPRGAILAHPDLFPRADAPREPLQTVEPKFLSMKTLLLLALASIKRVGDLHAFSVDDSCQQFGPADSQIILRPRLSSAQGSHYSIQGPGGEPASAAPGGGRPSPGFALSRPSIETLR